MPYRLFNPHAKSLARGNILVLGSVVAALLLSGAPHLRANLWNLLPAMLTIVGTAETVRNIRPRWSFYHAGVLFCIYMDLMAVMLVWFLLVYPYVNLDAKGL